MNSVGRARSSGTVSGFVSTMNPRFPEDFPTFVYEGLDGPLSDAIGAIPAK